MKMYCFFNSLIVIQNISLLDERNYTMLHFSENFTKKRFCNDIFFLISLSVKNYVFYFIKQTSFYEKDDFTKCL